MVRSQAPDCDPLPTAADGRPDTEERPRSKPKLDSYLMGATPRRRRPATRPVMPQPSPFGTSTPRRFQPRKILLGTRQGPGSSRRPVSWIIGRGSSEGETSSGSQRSDIPHQPSEQSIDELIRAVEDFDPKLVAHQSPNVQTGRGSDRSLPATRRCCSYFDDDILPPATARTRQSLG